VSQATATQLRIENSRDRYHAGRADRVQPADQLPQGTVLRAEDVYKGLAEKEALLSAQGKEIDAAARRSRRSAAATRHGTRTDRPS